MIDPNFGRNDIEEFSSRDGIANDFPWKNSRNGRRLQENDISASLNATDVAEIDDEDLINDETAQYIANPVVCTTKGSAILFENIGENKYPVYVRDSLLNTN